MKFVGNRDIAVTVKHLETSRKFYETVFGFKPDRVEEKLVVYSTGKITLCARKHI